MLKEINIQIKNLNHSNRKTSQHYPDNQT